MAFLKDSVFKGRLIADAVSYIRKFSGETIVIKIGGSALSDPQKIKNFALDVVMLKNCGIDVIVIHGIGSHIDRILDKFGRKQSVVENVRVSTKEDIELIEMIISGHINKQIVQEINFAGGVGVGLSGKDASLITAAKMRRTKKETDSNIERLVDFGYLGSPKKINTEIFEILSDSPVIPVISPVGFDEYGNTYTINADNVAGAIASAVRANRLVLMTESDGLIGEDGSLISSLSRLEAESLRKSRVIKGSSLAKLDVCIEALKGGVFGAHMINSKLEHSLLIEMLTKERMGTFIFNNEANFTNEDFEFED